MPKDKLKKKKTEFASSFSKSIKFTSEISDKSVNFLAMRVAIDTDNLFTSVFYKTTDACTFLLFVSANPEIYQNDTPYSQLFSLRPICRDDSHFMDQSNKLL